MSWWFTDSNSTHFINDITSSSTHYSLQSECFGQPSSNSNEFHILVSQRMILLWYHNNRIFFTNKTPRTSSACSSHFLENVSAFLLCVDNVDLVEWFSISSVPNSFNCWALKLAYPSALHTSRWYLREEDKVSKYPIIYRFIVAMTPDH